MTWTMAYAKDLLTVVCLAFSIVVYALQALEYVPTIDAVAILALMGVTIAALNHQFGVEG